MKKTIKKTVAVSMFLIFLLSVFSTGSAKNTVKDIEFDFEKFTFHRHSIDGSVTEVIIDIKIDENRDLSELLEEKCKELFEKDAKFQSYIKDQGDFQKLLENFTGDWGILLISSHGRGLHLKSKPLLKMLVVKRLFKLRLPKILANIKIPVMFCRYPKDPKANTTIVPLVRSLLGFEAKNMTGNHSVYVRNFIGFTTWNGISSFSPFDKIPRAFFGICQKAICHKLP